MFGNSPLAIPYTFKNMKFPNLEDKMKTLQKNWEEALAAHELARTWMIKQGKFTFIPFKQGDKVWLDTRNIKMKYHKKIGPKREGPFEIIKVIGPVTYWLKLPPEWKIHPVFHATLLRPYQETEVYGAIFPRLLPKIIEGEEVYEVEWILKHRKWGWGCQYYVVWKGYPISEASWEPEQVFSDDGNLLTKYKLNHHLWPPQLWSNYPFQLSKIRVWSKRGDWMIAWTKPDKLGSFSNDIRTTWQLIISQKHPFLSSCKSPIGISKQLTNEMSNSSESCPSSPDEYPFLTATELSQLLLDQEMNFAVSTTFSSSPLSTVLLWHYLFLSHNIERIQQDLTRHQLERQSIFDILSHSTPFCDTITPIVFNFRLHQRQVSLINPPTTFQTTSHPSTSENVETRWSVIIQERSNSNDSLLSFYTAAHVEPGTRDNPIDVDQLLDRSPSPPWIPVYSPPCMQSAPVTAPCTMCRWHGHTLTQCVWYGLGICSYCEEVRHTQHTCNELWCDRLRFNPHLLYCLTCWQSGHTSSRCNMLPSYQWSFLKSGILED